MEYDHTISGLQRKRNELAQSIERNGRELDYMRADLKAIDAALRVFGVLDCTNPRKLHVSHFKRGEIPRLIYAELRVKPVTVEHIVNRAMAMKGKDTDSLRVRQSVARTVKAALARMEREGRVRAREGAGSALLWEMVRSAP